VVFSSIVFLVYFLPLLLLLYWLTPHRARNLLLLVASIVFYSWGAPRFIFVILGTTFLDFFLVQTMDRSSDPRRRKLIMILSVCMNLGLLFYFKYCNFFIDNVNGLLEAAGLSELPLLNVVLPIGISFYTFESLTYVIDVYRKVHKPLDSFWNYQLYIILFPKLIAGPIIRYHEIADQIPDRRAHDNADNKLLGFSRFTLGLAKKVFIANTLAAYADRAFADPAALSGATAWLGLLSYTFQIYFDFSGYSDMAIGLGRFFGFRFPENFDNPYTSQSITEFWRRWHITLGRWMKNYLYIPLGGSRVKSRTRLYFNLWLVFLASGFWHGASWTFIAWGAYHGSFLVLERLFLSKLYVRAGRLISTVVTFLLVSLGWVLFRADTIAAAGVFYEKLFTPEFSVPVLQYDLQFVFYFALAVLFSFFTCFRIGERVQLNVYHSYPGPAAVIPAAITSLALFSLAVAALASSEFNPFIYFRF
jgi:alginate O-acetyltransferase complex protein AlgI